MKTATSIIALCLLVATVGAAEPRYILIAIREDASAGDKAKITKAILELPSVNWHGLDRGVSMPLWRAIADPAQTWRIMCLDAGKTGSPWPKIAITADQYIGRFAASLAKPGNVQVLKGDDPRKTLWKAGLEAVPLESKMPEEAQ